MTDTAAIDPAVLAILQALVVDNSELERLEHMLDQFNIFEAVGAVRQEVRHSDFLAFLLDPHQRHGLGDVFVKRLLQKAVSQSGCPAPITPIDLALWDLDDLDVRREWQNIDIFLLDENHQTAVIIENKIGSGEHDDQLQKYWQVVAQHRPGYKIIGLFLTPEEQQPSDDRYIAIGYQLICQIVEELVASRSSTLGQGILTLMSHYALMLRRYIVGESEIEQLCQQIYRKHKQALDLIYEYRVDQQAEIKDVLVELIAQNPTFELDHYSKSYINFVPKKWDTARLSEGKGWTRSGRILLFQFTNTVDSLKLSLSIGPGPAETRQKLFDMAGEHEPPFKRSFKTPGRLWSTIYNRNLLTRASYQDKSIEEISEEINRRWKEFLEHEFPKLDAIVSAQDWL